MPMNRIDRCAMLLAPLLGALASLGFAPWNLKPLPVLALAGLLWLLRDARPARALCLAGLFALAHYLSGTYWLYISTAVYGGAAPWLGVVLTLLACLISASYPALVCAGLAWLRALRGPVAWFAVPAGWLLAELARAHMPVLAFPWLSWGDVMLDTPLARLAPLIGVHGLSALMALTAVALAQFWAAARAQRLALAALVLLPYAAAALAPAPLDWTRPAAGALPVAIVQGNIPMDQKWLPQMQRETLHRYRSMTLAAEDARLIVWPEAALAQRYDQVRDPYLGPLAAWAREREATLLLGSIVLSEAPQGVYNSIVVTGAAEGRYDKRHLVPFGEYFPIPDWLRPLLDVLGTPYSDFLFGAAEQPPLPIAGQPVGLFICFEDVFADEFRRSAREAALLVSVTNDAWFGRSIAAEQHLAMARLRSLETGRETIRASNTGRSALIGADGSLLAASGFFTTELLRAQAQPRSGQTPYARWGDAPLWLLVILALLVLALRRRYSA